jgi:drug/metabolite transporter (DMT)-like permease
VDVLLILLVVVWGSAFPGITVLGEVLDPYQMTWYRYVPFLAIYGLWLVLARRQQFAKVSGNDWLVMGAVGVIGVVGYHFALNWGLDDTGDGAAVTGATGAILVATTPLWTLFISAATGHERFNKAAALGSLVAFAGVAIVVLLGRGAVELTFARKALVILIAPVSWAVYSIFTRPLILRYGGLFVTGVTLSLGTLVLLPLGVSYGVEPLAGLQAHHWMWLVFLALLSTVAGYAVWNHALKKRQASQVTVYVYFNPVVATIVGVVFLRESITAWFLAGAVLVMVGVILVNRARLAGAVPPAGAPASPPAQQGT